MTSNDDDYDNQDQEITRKTKPEYCIDFDDIQAAAKRIEGTAHKTPVLTSQSIDDLAKCRVFFKVEAMQKTGSFKFRGALNAVRSVLEEKSTKSATTTDQDGPLQVVTHSSGNHAQALALAAKLASTTEQVTATIVMPENAPSVKRQAVEAFGGIPVMTESTNEARERTAEEIRQRTGATFLHPSEDPRVIAGQGTVCLELHEQTTTEGQSLDTVIIPVGGGGLAAGNTVALRALYGDKIRIVLAEPAALDDAKRSFQAKTLLGHTDSANFQSVADGLKTTLGPNTWPIVRDMVDGILTVSEREILVATKLIWERLKVCIEPSAGVGVAVLLSDEFREAYGKDAKNVGVILCGGNVDMIKVAQIMKDIEM